MVTVRGTTAVLCFSVLYRFERVCAFVFLLSEPFACIAVGEVEALLLTVKCFHEHCELLTLGGDEVEFLGGGGVGHIFRIEAARGRERVCLHVTGAGVWNRWEAGGGGGDGCDGAREHAVEV